ncbi:hypothetical protein [Halocatena halophila]|uniref:hypothetical protein n=1 Tax=Halocatena halophila TaxID=2814576 RepID=UPI002ED6ABB5
MDSSNLRNQLDQVKEGAAPDDEQTEDHESTPTPPEPSVEEAPTTENTASEGGPAFTASESKKLSIYPEAQTARRIKLLCNSVENELLGLGYDDFEVREAHDAMVRLAHENHEEITRLVLEARDISPEALEND